MDERSWGNGGARLSRLQASSDFGSTLKKAGQQQGKSAFFSLESCLVGKGGRFKGRFTYFPSNDQDYSRNEHEHDDFFC